MNCSEMLNIINDYKFAWENHDLKLLREIFEPDATYCESPENIFYGIEEIIEYWKGNDLKQRHVEFELIEWFCQKNKLVFHWKCRFYHVLKEKYKIIQGVIWLELNSKGKIVKLTEYYHKAYEKG